MAIIKKRCKTGLPGAIRHGDATKCATADGVAMIQQMFGIDKSLFVRHSVEGQMLSSTRTKRDACSSISDLV